MKKSMSITRGRGFHIRFDNGYTVSVQWGGGNYCDNHREDVSDNSVGEYGSNTAEVAVLKDGDRELLRGWPGCASNSSVGCWLTPAQVLEAMNWAAKQPNRKTKKEER